MVIQYYFDFLSQPSRALYMFLKLSKIPFEACPVALMEGEHLSEEFKEKNRFQKVPFIHDGDFKLAESVGIFRYLTREYQVDDHWYPKDSKKQAKVDEFLEWQHLGLRFHCGMYFQSKWLRPLILGRESNPESVKKHKKSMEDALDKFEALFLSNGPFIMGENISFGDILAACEIEQIKIAGYEPEKNRPTLQAWFENVRRECNPFYDEAHKELNRLAEDAKKDIQAKL